MAYTWNADQTGGTGGSAGVAISSIIMPAYRIAGITQRAGIGPNVDMYGEAIPAVNRLLASWNCDGHKIYTTAITEYPLVAGQKIYTIGPGGEMDSARPVYISGANCIFPTSPQVRQPVAILDDDEWSQIAVQDIPGAPVYQLYYDGSYDENGLGRVYLRFQPPADYILEVYAWQSLQANFAGPTDVAVFPPGYEKALVYNLAADLAALNPGMANMAPASYEIARQSLNTLIGLNSQSPKMDTEAGLGHGDYGSARGWLDGSIR